MQSLDWADPAMRCFGMLIDGRARPTGVRQRGTEAAMLIVLNAHHDLVEFALPIVEGGTHWILKFDTNIPSGTAQYKGQPGDRYGVTGRSLALFIGATPAT
jgi:isoamylase